MYTSKTKIKLTRLFTGGIIQEKYTPGAEYGLRALQTIIYGGILIKF